MISTLQNTRRDIAKLALLALIGFSAFLPLTNALAAPADDGKTVFDQKCKGCHSIGGGKLVGPDLKGLLDRQDRASVAKFIIAPTGGMPNLGISQQEADNLLAYIDAASKGGVGPASTATPATGAPATEDDVERGRRLFVGEVAFEKGGLACASCHSVRSSGGFWGGNVGKDLSATYGNLGPDSLRSLLGSMPFPIMREAFRDHPLTEAEIASLTAFLHMNGETGLTSRDSIQVVYLVLVAIGLILVLVLFHLVWRGRLQGVRQSLLKGGSK